MKALRALSTDRTHLFPGARLHPDGLGLMTKLDVIVLFSDGAHVEGVLTSSGEQSFLHVDEYQTTAGTEIPAKDWELSKEQDGGLRVIGPAIRLTGTSNP